MLKVVFYNIQILMLHNNTQNLSFVLKGIDVIVVSTQKLK